MSKFDVRYQGLAQKMLNLLFDIKFIRVEGFILCI